MNALLRILLLPLLVLAWLDATGRFHLCAQAAPAEKSRDAAINYEANLVRANQQLKEGNLEGALAAAEAARRLDPTRHEADATAAVILHAAGRSAEARASLERALERVPEDQQAKVENIKRLIASNAESGGTRLVPETQTPMPLSSTARRQLDMLQMIIEEADKAASLNERTTLLQEFLEKSESFVKEQPAQMTVWILRAVAGLELNQARTAWEAGRQLTRLGADNSDDPKLRRVMAMLERRGWLGDELPAGVGAASKDQPFENSLGMKFVPVPGTDALFSVWETRKGDYAAYARANPGVDGSWQNTKSLLRFLFQPVDGSWQNAKSQEVPVSSSDDHPVVRVSWHDARAFCEWLTRQERAEGRLGAQQFYRLPTDAEWSLAVGLTNETGASPRDKDEKIKDVYPWGRQWPPPAGAGNYADETTKQKFPSFIILEGYRDGYATTAPVGSFAANQFGLHDLGGNVWEWCEDKYAPDTENRVLRGGSWDFDDPRSLLSSYRLADAPGNRNRYFGFRVVLVSGSAR